MFKTSITLLVLGIIMAINSCLYGCDLCSIYMGINPNDYQSSFGIRYRYRVFEKNYYPISSNLNHNRFNLKGIQNNKHNGIDKDYIANKKTTYTETYNSYDIFANIYLNNRIQLNVSTYFADNYVLNNDSIIDNIGGIGDVIFLLKYQLFNSKKREDTLIKNKFTHRLTIGGGINLPTGNFNKSSIKSIDNGLINLFKGELDPHLQAGTGSFSYLLLVEYLTRYKKIGFNGNISYRINTTNNNGFRFANRLNTSASLFIINKLAKKIKLMSTIGSLFETSNRDQLNKKDFLGSGGQALFINGGLRLLIHQFNFEANYYLPVYENLLDNQPFNKHRIVGQLTYYF